MIQLTTVELFWILNQNKFIIYTYYMIYITKWVQQLHQFKVLTDIIHNLKNVFLLPLFQSIVWMLLVFFLYLSNTIGLENSILSVWSWDSYERKLLMRISIAFVANNSSKITKADAKLLKQQLLQSWWWYASVGSSGWNSTWLRFLHFPFSQKMYADLYSLVLVYLLEWFRILCHKWISIYSGSKSNQHFDLLHCPCKQ